LLDCLVNYVDSSIVKHLELIVNYFFPFYIVGECVEIFCLKGSVKYIIKAFKVSEGKDITDEIDHEEHDYD
jgi:hypothetical protein